MKIYKFMVIAVALVIGLMVTSCEDEKEVLVIEGNIPIKTSTLYRRRRHSCRMGCKQHVPSGCKRGGPSCIYLRRQSVEGRNESIPYPGRLGSCSVRAPYDSRLTHKQGRQYRAFPAVYGWRRPQVVCKGCGTLSPGVRSSQLDFHHHLPRILIRRGINKFMQ